MKLKNFLILIAVAISAKSNAQVGIGAPNPNGATALEVRDSTKGILIPRLTNAQRDSSLSDNNVVTVPPMGVKNAALDTGTLIFNKTIGRFEFWDGELWRPLFVNTVSGLGNEGVVQILGQNGNPANKPTVSITNSSGGSYGTTQYVNYAGNLAYASSPTTSWPENQLPAADSNIYRTVSGTGRFLENTIPGQFHQWRVICEYTIGNNSSAFVEGILDNPLSGFSTSFIQPVGSLGNNNAQARLTFIFFTIADGASLPNPFGTGQGYRIGFRTNTSAISNFQIISITRFSASKD